MYLIRDLHLEYVKNTNNKKINNPIKKWAKDIKRQFSKEDMCNKHMNSSLKSLAIKAMKIKTTMATTSYPLGCL